MMRFGNNAGAVEPHETRQLVHLRSIAGDIVKFAPSEAGAHRHHIYTRRVIFGGEALAKAQHKGFHRGVKRATRLPGHKSCDGGNIDNAPEAARDHGGPENMAKLGHSRHHDLHHIAMHIPTHLIEITRHLIARIIDQIVDLQVAFGNFISKFRRGTRVGQIGGQHGHLRAKGGGEFAAHFFKARFAPRR